MATPKRPAYHIHDNGFIMPPMFLADNFTSASKYEPDDDDVFICTYPKCGTTWTQCMLHLLRNGGRPLEKDQHICHLVPHLEEDGSDVVKSLQRPRLIKTHLPYDLLLQNPNAKYLYIARNPKDCCVSFYHHTKGFQGYQFKDGTFDDYFQLFLEGTVDFGDYFDHLLSWFHRKDNPNVLFLLYEDMKENTETCLKLICDFLGGSLKKACDDRDILNAVLEKSSFDSMKKTPRNWSSKRLEGCEDFIRKGVVGNWREYFTDEQSKLLDDKFRSKLSGTGAEDLWAKYDI